MKQALKDGRFRDQIPLEMRDDVAKYLQNPGCPCNVPLYRKLLKHCSKQLKEYYPDGEISETEEPNLIENHFSVINCHINELAAKLQALPLGRKHVAVARFEDQVTCVINELDA